jgi:hypothetical protein
MTDKLTLEIIENRRISLTTGFSGMCRRALNEDSCAADVGVGSTNPENGFSGDFYAPGDSRNLFGGVKSGKKRGKSRGSKRGRSKSGKLPTPDGALMPIARRNFVVSI